MVFLVCSEQAVAGGSRGPCQGDVVAGCSSGHSSWCSVGASVVHERRVNADVHLFTIGKDRKALSENVCLRRMVSAVWISRGGSCAGFRGGYIHWLKTIAIVMDTWECAGIRFWYVKGGMAQRMVACSADYHHIGEICKLREKHS